ncbi:MAG: SWIM zinc finger family protein [Streptosporangiaceae bacterium]
MATATRPAVTEADLRAAAGERSFERGTRYLRAVSGIEAVRNQVIATVRGSADYLVVLTLPDRAAGARLRGECGCPYGQEGFFCKHCVAVGLAFLRDAAAVLRQRRKGEADSTSHSPSPARPPASSGTAASSDTAARARSTRRERPSPTPSRASDLSCWLNSLSQQELVALVCDQVVEDDDWRRRLELRAAAAASDVAAVSARAESLLRSDDEYGHYRFAGQYGYLEGPESWYFARRVRQVTDTIKLLTDAGQPGDAMVIAEQALAAIAGSSRHASDRAGVISAAATQLAAAHQEACRATASDPVRLADFLAVRMISAEEAEPVDPADYADLLGTDGMARLRDRITEAWTANPSGWPERLAMECVLRLQRDVDGLVAVLTANLDGRGLGHLQIAQELDQAGRAKEALAWAERGLRESPEPDGRLADFVAGRYCAAGLASNAVAVRMDRFEAAPSLPHYERLRDAAELAGTWESTRQWALSLLQNLLGPAARGWQARGPLLIDVLIADGDIEAAWNAAEGTASDDQWLRLANLVIETRPADALAVYRRLIAMLKQQTGDAVYERIAKLLVSARTCHHRLGTDTAFDLYLRALRDDQKRKRKLIRTLDAHLLR